MEKGIRMGEGYIEGLEDELNNPQSEQKSEFLELRYKRPGNGWGDETA
ncbi:hypothetical protein RCO48_29245 [Peribacillus frigoritolerans]|nr:hypothetical protein [Peribacillus frigoritolerans]